MTAELAKYLNGVTINYRAPLIISCLGVGQDETEMSTKAPSCSDAASGMGRCGEWLVGIGRQIFFQLTV